MIRVHPHPEYSGKPHDYDTAHDWSVDTDMCLRVFDEHETSVAEYARGTWWFVQQVETGGNDA